MAIRPSMGIADGGEPYTEEEMALMVKVGHNELCSVCGCAFDTDEPHADFCPNHQEQIEEAQAAYERGHIAA